MYKKLHVVLIGCFIFQVCFSSILLNEIVGFSMSCQTEEITSGVDEFLYSVPSDSPSCELKKEFSSNHAFQKQGSTNFEARFLYKTPRFFTYKLFLQHRSIRV